MNYSRTSGKRGSVAFHVDRIQARSASSVTDRARAEPAQEIQVVDIVSGPATTA